MWIKICANTNLQDAQLAVQWGANAVGFVFAPSPRQVTPAQARSISLHLPRQVERIGVFQTHTSEEIIQIVEAADLTGVQLHGEPDPKLLGQLAHHFDGRISLTHTIHWRVRPGELSPLELFQEQLRLVRREPAITRVLIDSQVGTLMGGTGVPFDWHAASSLRAELGDLKLIVAGGLRPENVEDAIQSLSPWGVDVASGVELTPGRKDPQKLKAFLEKASLSSAREPA